MELLVNRLSSPYRERSLRVEGGVQPKCCGIIGKYRGIKIP